MSYTSDAMALVTILLCIIILVVAYLQLRHKNKKILGRLIEVEETVALVLPISIAFRAELLAKLLPDDDHMPEMNALLIKLGFEQGLDNEEKTRLTVLLKERAAIIHKV